MAQKDTLVAELRQEKYLDIATGDPNIDLLRGKARFVGPHELLIDH